MKGNGNETFDIETQATNHPTTHLTNKSTSQKRPQFNDRSNPLHVHAKRESLISFPQNHSNNKRITIEVVKPSRKKSNEN